AAHGGLRPRLRGGARGRAGAPLRRADDPEGRADPAHDSPRRRDRRGRGAPPHPAARARPRSGGRRRDQHAGRPRLRGRRRGQRAPDRRRRPGARQARRPRPRRDPAQGRGGGGRVRRPRRRRAPAVSGLPAFALHRPDTLAEASALLAEYGDEAMVYAGGTELLVLLKAGLARPRALVDVKGIPGLAAIEEPGGVLAIGATATHRAVERSPLARRRCPLVADVARHVANVRVRSAGTVGGNLAFADPHSDLATLFLVLDGRVHLTGRAGARALALADFVRGPYETARADDEILTGVA